MKASSINEMIRLNKLATFVIGNSSLSTNATHTTRFKMLCFLIFVEPVRQGTKYLYVPFSQILFSVNTP